MVSGKRGWCGVRENGLVWCQEKGAGVVSGERDYCGVRGKGPDVVSGKGA